MKNQQSRTTTTNGPTWEAVLAFGSQDQVIVGIDEVGRGAWAGPVVAAAIILPFGVIIDGVNDSKLLDHTRRVAIDRSIRRQALAVGLGWVAADELDTVGLSQAVRLSGERALAALETDFELVLLDGNHNYLAPDYPSRALIKGDALLPPVAAASIVAKVARDRYMAALDRKHPGFGFAGHKGYGTATHKAALIALGASSEHRRSYAPIRGLA